MKNLDTRLIDLYEEWLLENYSDEIWNKEELMKASESGRHIDEFVKEVIIHLNGWTKDYLEFQLKKIETEVKE